MELIVEATGTAAWGDRRMRCALGRGGIVRDKTEGDGATPAGLWPMRAVLFRPDREAAPKTRLAVSAIAPGDGWCNDPADADYNRRVALPHPARCERLWRDDALYDLIAVLGYNDAPVRKGAGSAIFLHLARPGYAATLGCVALAREDLLFVLAAARPGDSVRAIG